jgi:C4-dicarboxylate-specific signal transduction histidine kinase
MLLGSALSARVTGTHGSTEMQPFNDAMSTTSLHAGDNSWHRVFDDARQAFDGPSDRMLAELCHDLRQPLTTLKMNLQAIVRLLERRRPRVAAALEAVADCLDAEQEVVEMLAGMTSATHHSRAAASPVALNALAADVQTAVCRVDPAMGKRVELRLAERSPVVNGDASSLRFALLSLVRHALEEDAADQSPRRVVVATRPTDEGAEMRVNGFPFPMILGPSLYTTLTVTHSVVRSHGGAASIEPLSSGASVRIVLPELRKPTDNEIPVEAGRDQ